MIQATGSKSHPNPAGWCLIRLYARGGSLLRKLVLRLARQLEGGELYSPTLRRIFSLHHEVDIGLYSHGGCFVPGMMDRKTTIGRYCSFASGTRVMNRNHPLERKSTHALFFNPLLGYVQEDRLPYTPLAIGNDVWIGYTAIILPNVTSVGDGAVVGAGAVVSRNIPPYAVVVGNPGRVVRYRFPPETIEHLLASRWWENPVADLMPCLKEFAGGSSVASCASAERNHGFKADHRR